MYISDRNLMYEISDSFNVRCKFIKMDFRNISSFDLSFRDKWFEENPYEKVISLFQSFKQNEIYCFEDQFLARYIIFRIPISYKEEEINKEDEFCVIGPYSTIYTEDQKEDLESNEKLSQMQRDSIYEYIDSLPRLIDEEAAISVIEKMLRFSIEDNIPYTLVQKHSNFDETIEDILISEKPIDETYANEVVVRYEMEAEMMNAVSAGDYKKVMKIRSSFSNVKVARRYRGNIRTTKMGLATSNTLFRLAGQSAGVHPAHLDRLSANMAALIENCTSMGQLANLNEMMVRKYCDLVNENFLVNYSKKIREIIYFINFNLKEPLSLSFLSERFEMDPKSLTTQFSKEVGKRLTEYINERRVKESIKFLTFSTLSIQEIAEKVGFLDDNYFARVFRKVMKSSPSEYRKARVGKTI